MIYYISNQSNVYQLVLIKGAGGLSQSKSKQFINHCVREKSVKAIRDVALLNIMLTAELRCDEIRPIDLSDYDCVHHELVVPCSKTHSECVCPVFREQLIW